MNEYWVFGIGGLAQLLFSTRLLIQWIGSEKEKKVISPSIFWQLSLLASFLLMVYGIFRNDIVIIAGQLLSYSIYIRNLQLKNSWKKLPVSIRLSAYVFPVASMVWIFMHNWRDIMFNNTVGGFLLTFGALGHLIFSLRFVVQWYHSEKQHESIFPLMFWIISLLGSIMILVYGMFRQDPVLIAGQGFGMIIYIRNVIIHFTSSKTVQHEAA